MFPTVQGKVVMFPPMQSAVMTTKHQAYSPCRAHLQNEEARSSQSRSYKDANYHDFVFFHVLLEVGT